MSAKYEIPRLRPAQRPALTTETGAFGVVDKLRQGFVNTRSEMTGKHPLEHSELFYDINQHQIKLGMSQNVFGLALPLSLQAERSMAAKVKRLPGIPSSFLHLEVLAGKDEDISIEDVFDGPNPYEEEFQHTRCNTTA